MQPKKAHSGSKRYIPLASTRHTNAWISVHEFLRDRIIRGQKTILDFFAEASELDRELYRRYNVRDLRRR
jgi:hypothetical protein